MKPTLEELVSYVDGEVSATRRREIELLIEGDIELGNTIQALKASHLPIQPAYQNVQYPALPDSLREQVLGWAELSGKAPTKNNWSGWSGMAVSACMASTLVIGYMFGQWQLKTPTFENSVATSATNNNFSNEQSVSGHSVSGQSDSIDDWARVVASYQSLYVRGTVEHLQPSTKLSISGPPGDIQVPDFSAQGYKFIRSQKLGYLGQPLIQLVYLAENGVPLALCIMPDKAESIALTQFSFESLNAGFWRDAGNRYVLIGDFNNTQLEQLQILSASL